MYDINVTLSTVLIVTLAFLASAIALAIGTGDLGRSWALTGGVLGMFAHGLAVRHWIVCSREREKRAYHLGRESLHSL